MHRGLKLVAIVAALAVVAGGLAVTGVALFDDDPPPGPETVRVPRPASAEQPDTDDQPLSRSEASRASRAALRVTGGGTVTELDRSDDPGERYEVEIVKHGRHYDIALDEDFKPVPNRRYGD